MFKKTLYTIIIFTSLTLQAQDTKLADTYFRKGEFEKAANLYDEIYQKQKHNTYVFQKLIKSWQALDAYEKVTVVLDERLQSYPNQHLVLVEKGYNLALQHKQEQANTFYQKALEEAHKNPGRAYQIARSFKENQLLDQALECYQLMVKANPNANYNYQIASIYGEKGDIEKMFDTYLGMVAKRGGTLGNIQRFIGRYITDDPQDLNNALFRKLLIKKLQQNPKDEWNNLLSWLYLQQKNYSKALIQEKAVYRRGKTNLNAIIDIGKIAFEQKEYTVVKEAFNYVLANTSDNDLQIAAHYYLLESQKKMAQDYSLIQAAYQDVFNQYGKANNTLQIQVSYADFLTFTANKPKKAVEVLENSLKNRLNRFEKAEVKIMLADILVFTGKFNQALIKYSQVQTQLRSHVLAQKARYKVAQTSYFKGDFSWANIQLKVLKRGTSNLISNDAIDLSLLIDDNIAQDSVQTALKIYAKADLLAYQNRNLQAIDTLSLILKNHKGHPIEDEALFKQAQLFEKLKQYDSAKQNYLNILDLEENDILVDDAIYHLAKLYDNQLNKPEKAKLYYEKIVLEQAASIYLVPARKRYRVLRGEDMDSL
jgi:tetratricopeptide (TPR) repeat protein